ncbi:MAG: hypothetical protein MJA29_06945, partial [Candidatus Omnitrophica bacterium]|nr:hypothetical protein [Candidatus Omnitrophota bacterium]
KPLGDILRESEVIRDLRYFRGKIKGPCGSCEKASDCYGCRGAAYQLTGDYLGSDPLCWKNRHRRDEITFLPVAADELIPQKDTMRLIDTLVSLGERCARASVTVHGDMPFVDKEGYLDESAYVEMVAQATAAMGGIKQLGLPGRKPEGFLLGARSFTVYKRARVDDRLMISVQKTAKYGDFGILQGRIMRGKELLAEGEIKIWHNMAEKES